MRDAHAMLCRQDFISSLSQSMNFIFFRFIDSLLTGYNFNQNSTRLADFLRLASAVVANKKSENNGMSPRLAHIFPSWPHIDIYFLPLRRRT